jgi:hypothetical protein
MNKFYGPSDIMASHEARERQKEVLRLAQKNMEKVKRYASRTIKYSTDPNSNDIKYKEAFEYVDNLFPGMKVKDVTIYQVMPKIMKMIGRENCAGLYNREQKAIILSTMRHRTRRYGKGDPVVGKATMDEVLAHELCHYCFEKSGHHTNSREIAEEFAYGWSLGYLRKKGHTDEEVIRDNFLPFLASASSQDALSELLAELFITDREFNNYSDYKRKSFFKKHGRKLIEKEKIIGTEKGRKLIAIYSKKLNQGTYYSEEKNKVNRFNILDI